MKDDFENVSAVDGRGSSYVVSVGERRRLEVVGFWRKELWRPKRGCLGSTDPLSTKSWEGWESSHVSQVRVPQDDIMTLRTIMFEQ
jgi:hypothetical protein